MCLRHLDEYAQNTTLIFSWNINARSLDLEANVIVAELQCKSWVYRFSSLKSKNKQGTALSAQM